MEKVYNRFINLSKLQNYSNVMYAIKYKNKDLFKHLFKKNKIIIIDNKDQYLIEFRDLYIYKSESIDLEDKSLVIEDKLDIQYLYNYLNSYYKLIELLDTKLTNSVLYNYQLDLILMTDKSILDNINLVKGNLLSVEDRIDNIFNE